MRRLCLEALLPIEEHISGKLARIARYRRRFNDRCPASKFLNGLERPMEKKFKGLMDAITKMGTEYRNPDRFRELHGVGKPLWEFKQFDHRLYCSRRVTGRFLTIVLFNGWVKQKKGPTEAEDREVERALSLYDEFMCEYPGGNI